MSTHGTNVIIRQEQDVTIVSFARPDVIDLAYIREAGAEMQQLAKTVDPPNLVIDFECVRYLSSAALGVMSGLNEVIKERGGKLGIANVASEVYGVFELTRLPSVIELHKSVPEAVRSMRV
jgi:anti-anti-sigma factor